MRDLELVARVAADGRSLELGDEVLVNGPGRLRLAPGKFVRVPLHDIGDEDFDPLFFAKEVRR